MLNILKEILFYSIGMVFIMLLGYVQDISLSYALAMIFIYLFYIVISVMFFNDEQEEESPRISSYNELKSNQNNQESIDSIQMIEDDLEKKYQFLKDQNFFSHFVEKLWPRNKNLLVKMATIPFKICFNFTIPYQKNPFLFANF